MIVIVTILLTVSHPIFSQKQLIGLKAGPSFTNVSGDFFEDADMRVGLTAGLTYDYFLSDNLSLGTEVLYSQRGFVDYFYLRDEQNNDFGTEIFTFNYDYIAIPLKISYTGRTKFYSFVSVGLIPAFLISAKTKIPTILSIEGETVNVRDRVAAIDVAGMFEVGAGYKFGDRYRIFTVLSGQMSLNKFTTDDYFAKETMRHYGLALVAGIKYDITK